MSKIKYVVGIVCIAAIFAFVAHNVVHGDYVVGVHGYEHGVALCGIEGPPKNDPLMVEDDFTMWSDEYATYSINWGHENDPEVRELEIVAKLVCSERE